MTKSRSGIISRDQVRDLLKDEVPTYKKKERLLFIL